MRPLVDEHQRWSAQHDRGERFELFATHFPAERWPVQPRERPVPHGGHPVAPPAPPEIDPIFTLKIDTHDAI